MVHIYIDCSSGPFGGDPRRLVQMALIDEASRRIGRIRPKANG